MSLDFGLIKFSLLLLLVVFSTHVTSASFTEWTKVKKIVVHDWAGILVELENDTGAQAEGCTIKNHAVLQSNHYLFNNAYAAILASINTQKDIRFYLHGCTPFGTDTLPILIRVDIAR